MTTTIEEIKKCIEDAEMILVGIGEEFEQKFLLEQNFDFIKICDEIKANSMEWVMPYVNTCFLKMANSRIREAYENLNRLLQDKDYFIVSVCMNGMLRQSGLLADRIVEPCGGYTALQCTAGCHAAIQKTGEPMLRYIREYCEGKSQLCGMEYPKCGICGGDMVFNSLYAHNYTEEGYRSDWAAYTNWLQKTLNKNILILELGVGMSYPSVIRFPFEKAAYYNQKSKFVRVHEKLFQLPENLSDRGYCLRQSAVELLLASCS